MFKCFIAGKMIDPGTRRRRIVVALTRLAVVGHNVSKVAILRPVAVNAATGVGALVHGTSIVMTAHAVSQLVTKGVLGNGTIPGDDGKHAVFHWCRIVVLGAATGAQIVKKHNHRVGSVGIPIGVDIPNKSLGQTVEIRTG